MGGLREKMCSCNVTKLLSLKLFLEHCIISQKSLFGRNDRYVHFVRRNEFFDVDKLDEVG